MKSMEDRLRSTAHQWSAQNTASLQNTSGLILGRMRIARYVRWGVSGGIATLAGAALWAGWSMAPSAHHELLPPSSERTTEYVAPADTVPRHEAPPPPVALPAARRRPLPETPEPATTLPAATPHAPLHADGNQDGFHKEYARIEALARSLRTNNPLAAMQQYAGLARLCERNGNSAMAVEAWRHAVAMAEAVGDAQRTATMRQGLEAAERQLR